mgnify:CR=1 FL=1
MRTKKNVACTNHSAEQEEAGSSHFSIDYADDRISIAWDDAPDGPARRTFAWIFQSYRDKECIEGTSVPPAGGRDGTAAAMGYTDRYPSDEDSDADAG